MDFKVEMSEVNPRWVRTLRELITSSLTKNGLPLPVNSEICNEWKIGLERGEGGRVLYTSCMYQMAPLINRVVDLLEKSGAVKGGVAARLTGLGSRILGGLLKPSDEERARSASILKSIYRLLRRSGVEFRLLEEEPYSGALLYELGFEEEFRKHAALVHGFFKRAGVREVITVDPHTHYVLERIYPRYVEFDIGVVSYLDLIKTSSVKLKNFVIHDSCLYSRYLGKRERVREILTGAVEDFYITGVETSGCCGGPIESVAPGLARKIAASRAEKLSRLSSAVVTTCPICLANLSSFIKTYDIAEVIE